MINNGWRKPTPGLAAAEMYAWAGEQCSVSKNQALLAVKRVAPVIGLKAGDLLILDLLAAFTLPLDWEEGQRPIVWASNHRIISQLGFSLSAFRRHIRRLIELGIIWAKDSVNGKRWGKRHDDGHIIEAYGFDLSPIAARAEEFDIYYREVNEEHQKCKSLRSALTISRRIIRAKIDEAIQQDLPGSWTELQTEFDELLNQLPGYSAPSSEISSTVEVFHELKERVEKVFVAAFPDHQIRTESQYSDENEVRVQECENFISEASKTQKSEKEAKVFSQADVALEQKIDLSLIRQSCPQFSELARDMYGEIRSRSDFHRAAAAIRPMAGVSEDAWKLSLSTLGADASSAAVALIFDKYSSGEVKSPGGYLRGLIGKAQIGELHLARSFYGRLKSG